MYQKSGMVPCHCPQYSTQAKGLFDLAWQLIWRNSKQLWLRVNALQSSIEISRWNHQEGKKDIMAWCCVQHCSFHGCLHTFSPTWIYLLVLKQVRHIGANHSLFEFNSLRSGSSQKRSLLFLGGHFHLQSVLIMPMLVFPAPQSNTLGVINFGSVLL